MRFLLLEDDYLLRKHIKKYFEIKGYKIDAFSDGEELLDNANLYDYDCFILDINVPNFNGYEIVEYLKNKNISSPVIFISALTDIESIKKAFKLGASDYLKKPFELAELEIRIERLLSINSDTIKLKDGYEYNLDTKTLYKDSKPINLSKKQNDILYILLKNRGNVVTFDTIADFVYGDEFKDYKTISSHIRDIRKKIEINLIKNVRGVGYKID